VVISFSVHRRNPSLLLTCSLPSLLPSFSALRGIFSLYDVEETGYISVAELSNVLSKIGRSGDDAAAILSDAENMKSDEGKITFEQFIELVERGNKDVPGEGPDPKVMEFLRILEEYRIKCEDEGNYLEAGRANVQVDTLRRQEEKRQQKAIRARQIAERTEVQIAHNLQYTDFNAAWDRYMEEYDNMAQMYIQQMTERHAVNLLEFQRGLQKDMTLKPPKWSRELLEWRRRQHILARQKNYAEAQKIKKIADSLEDKERGGMNTSHAAVFARKEASFRQQQQAELQALLKRIDARRKEHIKQRNLDCKRLLQRNRNVQAVLESKQAVESVKLFADIKKDLTHSLAMSASRTKDAEGAGLQ
jgi:hypothetical protein